MGHDSNSGRTFGPHRTAIAAFCLTILLLPHAASAQPETELRWEYPTFGAAEIALSGVMFSGLIAGAVIGPRDKHWTARNAFDERSRNKLRVRRSHGRQIVRDTSDVTLSLTLTYPFLIDALLMSTWFHQSPKTAIQLTLVTAEAMVVTAALTTTAKAIGSRVRPFVRECGAGLPAEIGDCSARNQHKSFFSGHAAMSFTAAAAVCMHHAHIPLNGRGAANMAPCAGMMVLAGSTALFRVMADQHFMTDVLTGAAVGTSVGLFIPWFFHYRHGKDRRRDKKNTWLILPKGLGATMSGTF